MEENLQQSQNQDAKVLALEAKQASDSKEQLPTENIKQNAEELRKQVAEFRKEVEASKDTVTHLNKKIYNLLLNEATNQKKQKGTVVMTLGEILVKKGIISRDQLEIALKEQRELQVKKELGTILVELNFITDSILSQVLSETSGVKSLDLRSMNLDAELIKRIPRNIAVLYKIIAISLEGDELHVATSDVYNVLAIDQVKRYFQKNIKVIPFFANDFQITEVIEQYYDYKMDMHAIIKEIETGETKYTGQEEGYVNPTVRFVDSVFTDAVKLGASDIHFEPESEFVRIRYRVDGELMQVLSFHKDYWSSILVRIKIISGMDIAESRNSQDGRTSMTIMGRKVDFRIATMPTIYGENVVSRILDKSRSLVRLEDLGFTEENLRMLKRLLRRPEGILVVTGPTGSGKTTTLYSILSYINSMNINIMTLEDPVEYKLPIIRQTQVKEDTDINFASGIRTMMRQDPDVIFVGEIRDHETATMAIRASMTGHQVFSTLHTNDSIGIIPRLVDMGIRGQLLSSNITGAIAQRLARRLCSNCKEQYTPNKEECELLQLDPNNPPKIYKHKGCTKCHNIGYKGRIAIQEILPIDKELDELIFKEASKKEVMSYANTTGFKTMADDATIKVLNGITDIEEIINTVDLTERLKNVSIFI